MRRDDVGQIANLPHAQIANLRYKCEWEIGMIWLEFILRAAAITGSDYLLSTPFGSRFFVV